MKSQDFRPAIRRALNRPCHKNLLARLAPSLSLLHGRRTAWVRIDSIVAMLKAGQPVNASILAARFQTTAKTIHRDMRCLRARGIRTKFANGTHTLNRKDSK